MQNQNLGYEFYPGEAPILTLPLLKEGKAVSLDGALEIVAKLYSRNAKGRIEIGKYSLNTAVNYGTLTANAQSVDIVVESADSENWPAGNFEADVVVTLPSAAHDSGGSDVIIPVFVGRILARRY